MLWLETIFDAFERRNWYVSLVILMVLLMRRLPKRYAFCLWGIV